MNMLQKFSAFLILCLSLSSLHAQKTQTQEELDQMQEAVARNYAELVKKGEIIENTTDKDDSYVNLKRCSETPKGESCYIDKVPTAKNYYVVKEVRMNDGCIYEIHKNGTEDGVCPAKAK
ncbi:hypothetical protein [Acinetobacter sp. ANC 4648]|uniref:hypothetical protein n=1 Tax=Acinetobacter sp. ANC 4648 TaxID=1977875 RepID=UPI000A35B96A|nr:hypothetical protein [Acinetobacter sp. ANC 4648]OTG81081.1 hypothetical protein B9T27_11525 [Acinetobacter sp. ANC 4648]